MKILHGDADKMKFFPYAMLISFIFIGCQSSNISQDDLLHQSVLSWRFGGAKKTGKLIQDKYIKNENLKKKYNKLINKENMLDNEIKIKKNKLKTLINQIYFDAEFVENNINAKAHLAKIEYSLDKFIVLAGELSGYVNKGKLLYKIQQAKNIKKKISIARKGTTKMGAKLFSRMIPGVNIFVTLWDIYDMVQPIKTENGSKIKKGHRH